MRSAPVMPVPTLDHVVINVRDRIDEGFATFRRLGFTLTPRGHHTLGSTNHLAIFGNDYLELIGAPLGETRRADILESPSGLNGLVFGTDNSTAVFEALRASGIAVEAPLQFSRPVAVPDGTRDATFRTVRLAADVTTAGRVYFCHHLTRDLVWRDEWRRHANGVLGVARAVIAAHDPFRLGGFFARMFGAGAIRHERNGCALLLGLSRFEIVTPEALASEFADAAPDGDGRAEFMAALTFRVQSLAKASEALAAGGIDARIEAERIIVSSTAAFNAAMEFRA